MTSSSVIAVSGWDSANVLVVLDEDAGTGPESIGERTIAHGIAPGSATNSEREDGMVRFGKPRLE